MEKQDQEVAVVEKKSPQSIEPIAIATASAKSGQARPAQRSKSAADDSGLDKELAMMAKAAKEFAAKQLAPNREESDKYPFGPLFTDVVEKAFGLDFFHILLPEALQGMSLGLNALGVVLENICREDASLGGIIFTTLAGQEILRHAGAAEPLKTICSAKRLHDFLIALPVFNNPAEVKHLAQAQPAEGGYTLSGTIEYVVLGSMAKQALIPARTPGAKDFSYFLVGLETAGLKKSEPVLSLGLHACPAVDMEFNRTPAKLIGQAGQGSLYFNQMADRMHAAAAAMSLGIMKGSFQEALDYARRREQGGQTIIHWSEVKMILANMALKINNAEMIVAQACQAADNQAPKWESRTRAAALHIQEMACDLTTDGIQVLGGVGYMKDFGQEKRFRDAKHIQALMGIAPVKKIKFLDALIS
ncbi:MAG: acyl-CoA dehydrogenase family protein [Desulfobacteraceae bacterium]|nr:acyl-CoA dehydrogenase family protein [Desulfobacteraceae bacterium]